MTGMQRWSQRIRGLTLVEMLVTITVLAILLAIVVPSIQTTLDRRRLIGAADNMLADMRYAQSESVKRNEVFVASLTPGAAWQYAITASATSSTFVSKTVTSSDYAGTSVSATTPVAFDPKRATINLPASGTVIAEITSANGQKLRISVAVNSALSVCTPTGLAGYPAC